MAISSQTDSYVLHRPKDQNAAVILSSPHSGRDYPSEFLSRSLLSERMIRSSEDFWVDRLFDVAPELGVPLLCARKPRAYIDLNRAPDELDPALIEGVTSRSLNPRILAGLGVIPRVVAHARAIYRGKISRAEADQRLSQYWAPYHQTLAQLIEETRATFGSALVLDCHSMPNEAATNHRTPNMPKVDIVLGDRYAASARPEIMDILEDAFRSSGLNVCRNNPFAGGYITQFYGRPALGVSAIQIEINRSLYMNETLLTPREDYNIFKETISETLKKILINMQKEKRLAAE